MLRSTGRHRGQRGRTTLVGLISIIAVVVVAGGFGLRMLGGFGGSDFSEGSRAGVVVKLSKKGTAVKTWEGQLMLGVGVGGQGIASNIWNFSIEDAAVNPETGDRVVDEVQRALDSGWRVRLNYVEKHFVNPLAGDTTYRVTGVVFIPENSGTLRPPD